MLYLHTIRYLRPNQVFWRVWRRLPVIPAPNAGPAPSLRHSDQALAAFPRRRPSLIGPDAFRFLNREGRIRSAADWNEPQADALWLYNLHYFDDLCADGAEARCAWHEALIARWIAENPVGQGCGWDPYPTSLRVVNWVKWALAGGAVNVARGTWIVARGSNNEQRTTNNEQRITYHEPRTTIQSLAVQARYFAPRVEWHLLGNHLLANAKALVFAGCFFEGEEAQEWLRKGLKILGAQLGEQVLADGGHFERSPMYHAVVLEDLLDLINLSHSYPGVMPEKLVDALRIAAANMLRWAGVMMHPDGGIAFFNDAAFGVAANFVELSRYAERLGLLSVTKDKEPNSSFLPASHARESESSSALTRLAESGYIRMQRGDVVVIFDAAPVGPDYLPGHAHADTLSFELSHGVQRVICNSGTSRYGRGPMRQWERSTAAHNTVEIDGENSSEVWDGFRVARRAYPVGLSVSDGSSGAINPRPTIDDGVGRGFSAPQGSLRVACAHDGYARLRGRPMHRRTIELSEDAVRWTDEVTGEGAHRVVGRIPLHPSVRAERLSEAAWRLALPLGESLVLTAAGVALDQERGRYSPEFGITMERQVLVWVVEGLLPVTVTLRLVGPAR
jgi:uncharacterized heparinase superfamily protein